MHRRSFPPAIGLFVVLALAGCTSSEAGFNLPTLSETDAAKFLDLYSEVPRSLAGSLTVESNGCFTWNSDDPDSDGAWIVWPGDASQDDDEVVLGAGERVGDGDAMNVTAGTVPLEELPQGADQNSYFGSFGLYCEADERGVLMITDIQEP